MSSFAFVPRIQTMNSLEIHRARDAHLRNLRDEIVPSKRQILAEIDSFVAGGGGGGGGVPIGKSLCERIFYVREYEVKPKDYHSWTPPRKQQYNSFRQQYIQRFHGGLPLAAFNQLTEDEVRTLRTYYENTQAWIDFVTDLSRDIEIAYATPHPVTPLDEVISPPIQSVYDRELIRRNSLAAAAAASSASSSSSSSSSSSAVVAGSCLSCQTDEYVIDTMESGLVCTNCGIVLSSTSMSAIDETSDSLPFGTQMQQSRNRGYYEMTENFMKNLDLLEGTNNNKVTDDAKEYVKNNVNGRAVTISLIRRILKQGGLQKFYPAASVIYEYVTGEQIEKCTLKERQQIHRMHVQYVYAFQACPESVRRRKSSLTNNYLTCKFYQMLGLSHRLKYLHMLKGDQKVREHDRVFSWIVEHVRSTSERGRAADGTTFWVWYTTPTE
jgi:hypothetical protein